MVSGLHLEVAAVGLSVDPVGEATVEERHELAAQELSPGHPLEVASAAVVVGAVELPSGELLLERASTR